MSELFPFELTALTFSLEWLTALNTSYNSEYRDQLRRDPRLLLSSASFLSTEQAKVAEDILMTTDGRVLLPDWRYAQKVRTDGTTQIPLASDQWSFQIGDKVCLWVNDETTFVGTVSGKSTDDIFLAEDFSAFYNSAMYVMPVRDGVVTGTPDVSIQGPNNVYVRFKAIVTEYIDLSSSAASPAITLDGSMVVSSRDFLLLDTHRFNSNFSEVDFGNGSISMEQVSKHYRAMYFHSMIAHSAPELLEIEKYLHTIAGRGNEFWNPTWLNDFDLDGISPVGDSLTVQNTQSSLEGRVQAVMIEYTDGTKSAHQVSAVTVGGSSTILTLATDLPQATSSANVVSVSKMSLHRFDTDQIDFRVEAGLATAFAVPTIEVLV